MCTHRVNSYVQYKPIVAITCPAAWGESTKQGSAELAQRCSVSHGTLEYHEATTNRKHMKPHSTTDRRFVSNQWSSILLQSATKYYHCIMSLLSRLTPDLTHTLTPVHSKAPDSSKLRTIMYMHTPIQQYLIIHTVNKGKRKFPSHSNTKTAGAIQEFKRHESHTTWYWSVFISLRIHSGPLVDQQ